jgi:hypothetical protein
MRFQRVNRTDADRVFINVRNVSGTAVSAHIPVQWDVVVATDGNAVTACLSGTGSPFGLFAGVLDQALNDSSYGECQVYGFRQSAYLSRASAGFTPGTPLIPVGAYFDGTTMSAATTSGQVFVTLMETITASAAYSSAAQVYTSSVFIRSM